MLHAGVPEDELLERREILARWRIRSLTELEFTEGGWVGGKSGEEKSKICNGK